MSHPRTAIRQAVKTALTGLPGVVSVLFTKTSPWSAAELPGISISTLTDDLDKEADPVELRDLKLQVEIVVRDTGTDVDTTIDQIEAAAVAAIRADLALDALVLDLAHESTAIEVESSGDQPIGIGTMTWSMKYER